MSPGRRAALLLLEIYRVGLRPVLPSACRYLPTCSDYAAGVIERHGVARGTALALRRLLRCHPFTPGGFDPVR